MSREGTWRRLARDGKIVVPVDEPMFARLEIAPPDEVAPDSPPRSFVEIDTGGLTIRLSDTTPADRIADVVLALSAGR
jgi:transposase